VNRSLFFMLGLAFLLVTGCETRTQSGHQPFQDLSLEAALELARSENKLVMVDFYTDWCHYCHVLDKQTWPDEAVQAWLKEKTIAIKINAEKNPTVARKYGVNSFPQIVFIRPDGSEVDRVVGFLPPAEFLKKAKGILAAAGGS
jgi:thiol:disulfide interchange protein